MGHDYCGKYPIKRVGWQIDDNRDDKVVDEDDGQMDTLVKLSIVNSE